MNSIIDSLSPETKETLLSWCEDHSYIEVKQLAAKPLSEGGLNLKISKSTLCRFYTTHGIADSKEARAQYAASIGLDANKSLLDAAHENLEQRLFELSARSNPGTAELRLLGQLITKLHALKLSERRVEVAEKREIRMSTPPPQPEKPKVLSAAEIKHRVRVLLGKELPRDVSQEEYEDWCKSKSQTGRPPAFHSNPSVCPKLRQTCPELERDNSPTLVSEP